MDNNKLQQELDWMVKELRALKSPQGMINNIVSYSATIANPSIKVKITYEDGKNDIVTRVYITGTKDAPHVLTAANNNVQYILTSHLAPSWIEGFRIVSTRPIISVENV